MIVQLSIGTINNKYLHIMEGDGSYYYFYDMIETNMSEYPPYLYNDDEIDFYSSSNFSIFDENTGEEYQSSDIVFKPIKINI